jgi:hypothetical protein
MAASTEAIALKVLRALQEEEQAHPSLLDCRTIGIVAEKICASQSEFDRVVAFLTTHGLVKAVRRDDGLAALSSAQGIGWIESHKVRWTIDRTLMAIRVVIALIAVVLAYMHLRKG